MSVKIMLDVIVQHVSAYLPYGSSIYFEAMSKFVSLKLLYHLEIQGKQTGIYIDRHTLQAKMAEK